MSDRQMTTSMHLMMDMLNDLTHQDGPNATTYVPVLQQRRMLERTEAAIPAALAARSCRLLTRLPRDARGVTEVQSWGRDWAVPDRYLGHRSPSLVHPTA
jgi:hypothetical protein